MGNFLAELLRLRSGLLQFLIMLSLKAVNIVILLNLFAHAEARPLAI